ncbi:hypothetical protein M140_2549 [Bacteroides fragilis str. S38L3]|nr:hypothetical protein M140_2549 [Bacteroides fragilis str. S38L3]
MSFRFVKIKRTITFAADKQSIHPLNMERVFNYVREIISSVSELSCPIGRMGLYNYIF